MAGRPSLTFSRTRSAAAKALEEEEPCLFSGPTFHRRFPRLGAQFQAKVPKQITSKIYVSERPNSIPISNEFLHLTKEEVLEGVRGVVDHDYTMQPILICSHSIFSQDWTTSSRGIEPCKLHSNGPLPIARSEIESIWKEKSSNETDVVPINDDSSKHHKQWIEALLHWHEAKEMVDTASAGRGRRSRYKRPREVPPIPSFPAPRKLRALETLETKPTHSVSIEQQQWSLLVELAAGQASKRIREQKRSRSFEDTDAVQNLPPLPRWRNLVRTPNFIVKGDYRGTGREKEGVRSYDLPQSHASLEAILKALLACASAYQKRISDGQALLMSNIDDLFEHSFRILPNTSKSADSVVGRINAALDTFVHDVNSARKMRAEWMDLWHQDGVELDTLRKSLKNGETALIQPDELPELNRQVKVVSEWQTRLDQVKTSPRSSHTDLQDLEDLYNESESNHALRSKGLLALEARLDKAYELRDRIMEWKTTVSQRYNSVNAPALENVKFLASLIREISRLRIMFPAAAFVLDLSQKTEAWIERANVAIRSRISLSEIKLLIRQGHEIPLDLSEYLEKLKARETKAQEWLDQVSEILPVPDPDKMSILEWTKLVRAKLEEEASVAGLIHDLASEGSRIPVEIDFVKLLQIELDARHWSSKARTWIPSSESSDTSKKGKLEDIREHLEKASLIRTRLILPIEEKQKWKLDGEQELTNILEEANDWSQKYREFLEGDSRRGTREEVSISFLREIVENGNAIHANLAPASTKIAKVLSQAEAWYEKWQSIIAKCDGDYSGCDKVLLADLKEATKESRSTINVVDLKEAVELEKIVERVESWLERANFAVGGKRPRGKQKYTFGMDDMRSLLNEGKRLPIDAVSLIAQLENVLNSVSEWKATLLRDVGAIADGFQQLKNAVDSRYGDPAAFSPSQCNSGTDDTTKESESQNNCEEESTLVELIQKPVEVESNLALRDTVEDLIKRLCQEAKSSCLVTDETSIALQLEDILRWTARSLKYVENQREIFDSRFFGAFERFLAEGKSLLEDTPNRQEKLIYEASLSWRSFIGDQLIRMDVLLKRRDEYVCWCKRVSDILSGNDKKVTIEKLRDLLRKGSCFPGDNDAVSRIHELAQRSEDWITIASAALRSNEKLPLHEAKGLLEEGNRLGVLSCELRALRGAVNAARTWANKVKRVKPEEGMGQLKMVKGLLEEYDDLVIGLPEEYNRLSKSVQNYCICRRPYDGFMIKCEKCDDWFHGPCVGVTPLRAEKKVDKYVCVRCHVASVFQSSASSIVGVLRKWTSDSDLKKTRLSEAQKLQRKIRKETKELEKLRAESELASQVSNPLEAPVNLCQALDLRGKPLNHVLSGKEGDQSEGTKQSPSPCAERNRVEKVASAIQLCQSKLQNLADEAVRQRNEEELENAKAEFLKRWCIRVRSLVLAPSTEEQVLASRPPTNGLLPSPMVTLVQDAEKHGLTKFADVKTVLNAFQCLCWSSYAMDVFAKRPKASDVVAAVRHAASLKLADEKGLKMIKGMAQRATAWTFKASRLLMPVPGEKRPYDMKELRSLAELADDIPLRMPLEPRVQAVIEDSGSRHCVCGGPSDGRLMLSCDNCDIWFHAHCVGVRKQESEEIEEWSCPPCRGQCADVSQDVLVGFHDAFGKEEDSSSSDDDDVSSKAPQAKNLWPPFGILGSPTSVDVLGEKLCSFQDDTGPWDYLHRTASSTSKSALCRALSSDQMAEPRPPTTISIASSRVQTSEAQSTIFIASPAHIVSSSSSLGSVARTDMVDTEAVGPYASDSGLLASIPPGAVSLQSHPVLSGQKLVIDQSRNPAGARPSNPLSLPQHLHSLPSTGGGKHVVMPPVPPVEDGVAQLLALRDIIVAPVQD